LTKEWQLTVRLTAINTIYGNFYVSRSVHDGYDYVVIFFYLTRVEMELAGSVAEKWSGID